VHLGQENYTITKRTQAGGIAGLMGPIGINVTTPTAMARTGRSAASVAVS